MHSVKNSSVTANNSPDVALDEPPLAIRSDGKILVSVVDLADIDLSGRELWTGLVLTQAEAAAIHPRFHFEEAAAFAIGDLRRLDKKAKNGQHPPKQKKSGRR